MATPSDFLKIVLRNPVCIKDLGENSLRLLVEELVVQVTDPKFSGFVLSDNGTQVRFNFPGGNFGDATAKVNGEDYVIIPGLNQKGLEAFRGPPTNTNPGYGWKVEIELTQEILQQPPNQAQWKIFYASRVPVLNAFSSP